ncbi:MAG: M48 family metalloprotease [Rhizobiaceae bacterium]|nr:M48 family metalloprotease [Rhizobiaceae bacterium]
MRISVLTTRNDQFEFLRKAGRLTALSVLLLAGFGLASCTNLTGDSFSSSSLKSSWVKPDDPQEKMGAKEHPLVLAKYGGEYSDSNAEKLIALVVGRLVSVSLDPARVYKITLLNSPKVNAFALPGGYLYVTRGLLALANDSSELAAVIAHEMAHVSSNHAILRQEKISSIAIGKEVVDDVLGGNLAGKVALAANKIRLSNFSKDQELQADAVSIRMIGRAGFDPFASARFLKTMSKFRQLNSRKSSKITNGSFLSSHPTTPERVELAKRHARFFGAPGFGERERERYLKGISGLLYGNTTEEGFVRGQTFTHAGLGIRFVAPKGFAIHNQPHAVTLTGPSDIATRFDAAVLSKRKSLAGYLKSGWINGLINETIREETVNGLPAATALAAADGWRFRIQVIRNGEQLYRFITAAPQSNLQVSAVSEKITGSLHVLSEREIGALSPLRIKIVTASKRDTLGSLAKQMRGVGNRVKLFKVLNSLSAGAKVQAGQQYKIVTDLGS